MFFRTLAVAIFSVALLFSASGCGSSCSSACSKIYDECKFSIEGLSEEDCVNECDGDDITDSERDDVIDCVMKASCTESAMGACFY